MGTEHLRPVPCGGELQPAPMDKTSAAMAAALSGGGFRATLAGVGALRLVASIGALQNLRFVSSVSGGSIANGLVAKAWPDLRAEGLQRSAFDDFVVEPLVRRSAASRSRGS